MCTYSEVLLQRVSILLLQVEGREEGRGCNSNGNKSAHTDNEIQGYISMQRNKNMKQHNVK